MSRLLEDLNEAQYEAVSTTDGPLLVIAGAGSGKTRVLTRRLAYILTQQLARPHEILAVTFTNKAAGEMKERVSDLLGGGAMSMNVSTFHSFCARFLRQEAKVIGYDSQFTIFDSADSQTLMKNCIKELGLSTSQFTPKAQLRKVSDAKNKLINDENFAANSSGYFEQTTAKLYTLYQRRLRECDAMDFDDLLFNAVTLLTHHEEIGQQYRDRFKYIMVDEYQDTNHVQYLLLKALVGDHHNICVVGDEDQSIYGWRGADIRNILDFEKDFPGAKVIKLEMNYRSTDVILAAASTVIKNNAARKDKTLRTSRTGGEKIGLLLVDSADEEAVQLVNQIRTDMAHTPLREMAILYRTNAQSRAFEEQLRRANMPYQIFGGISFYQRKEIKDLMAYLKLIANVKDDVSFQRVVNYPKRGIGNKSLSDLTTLARRDNRSLYETALAAGEYPELSGRSSRLLQAFVALMEKYRTNLETQPIDILISELVEEINLLDELKSEDQIAGQTRIENIEAFIEGIAEYARANPENSLTDYLSEISLFSDIDEYRETEEKVTMMTVHSAKGLEYDTVFLVGLEEGLFPLARTVTEPMELEEERRLFYVGSTRARKRLYLATATTRYRFGEVESIPSRFIKEIPERLINRVDLRKRRHYEYSGKPKQPTSFFGSTSAAPRSDPGVHYEFEEEETIRPGRIVQHPTFGRGKVVKAEGYGESLMLEIMFQGIGIKKIMAKYARLKVIG